MQPNFIQQNADKVYQLHFLLLIGQLGKDKNIFEEFFPSLVSAKLFSRQSFFRQKNNNK